MRRSISLLVISGLLPIVALGGAFGVITLRAERQEVRQGADVTARFTAALASSKLVDGMQAVNMIAQSPAFDGSLDIERLRTLANRLRAGEHAWRTLSVADPAGNRILDIPTPVGGRPGGPVVDRRSLDLAVRTGQPVVGNVVAGPRGGYAFAIRAPVVRSGQIRYVISAVVAADTLGPLLRFRALPRGWRAAIVDGAGNLVATSEPGSNVVGHALSSVGLRSRAQGQPQFYEFQRHDGTSAIGTWAPIVGTGWSAHVSAPAAAYSGPATQALALLVCVAAACLVLLAILINLLATELKQNREREAAEVQRHRMEALGRLTGGVAHDFNNLLTPILGGLDIIRRRIGGDTLALRHVDSAIASAERARSLVSRLLSFSRRQTLSATHIDVGTMLQDLGELLVQAIGEIGEVEIDVASGPYVVVADRNQLELAILNLAINARDAMPDGGKVRISAGQFTVDGADDLKAGNYVSIAVSDQGVGMDETTLRHAVDPFFTTKAIDQGTGLGLSMVHGFAAQSGGVLRLESVLGSGTTAVIILPEVEAPQQTSPTDASAPTPNGTGTILLVDDQPSVRAAAATMLKEAGYSVVEAASVDEALEKLGKTFDFDAIVTDYVMPGRSGAELIRLVRDNRPNMPILLVTGYADAARDIPAGVPKLSKPYRSVELISQIAQLGLEAGRRTEAEIGIGTISAGKGGAHDNDVTAAQD